MTDRTVLVRAIQQAQGGRGLASAVAALDAFDRDRRAEHAQARELDLAATQVTARLSPVAVHEHHTAATDWLADYEAPSDYRTSMIAEASAWYSRLDPAVRADREELGEQAWGRARSLSGKFGSLAPQAEREFLSYVAFMTQAASGLPQIEQTVDPNNQPSATPLPDQVFDNFAPPQNDYNGGVEGENHDSSISSQNAPLVQQVQQQDGGGSGYGSGPEKPDEHTTSFDTSNSYAEVPLGTPGQIPTAPAPVSQQGGGSTPNPVAGTNQVADSDHLQNRAAAWSAPDGAGFRWIAGSAYAEAPFHVACRAGHWPDERCGGIQHAASVAIGYSQSYQDVARTVALERVGMEEGRRVLASSRTPADLLEHHNRLVTAYAGSEREADDAAVLHGFLAVVRPVLAGKPGCDDDAGKPGKDPKQGMPWNQQGNGATQDDEDDDRRPPPPGQPQADDDDDDDHHKDED